MKIGIIGGYGKFGSKLSESLEKIGHKVLRSRNKHDNQELAQASELITLTVPPQSAEKVIQEICYLPSHFEIFSFIAQFPLASLRRDTKRAVSRAMSDPGFTLLVHAGNSPKAKNVITDLAGNVFEAQNDEQIDDFTVLLTIYFICKDLMPAESDVLIQCKRELTKYFSTTTLNSIPSDIRGGAERIKLYQTKGGLSEAIVNLYAKNPDIQFAELRKKLLEIKL